MAMNQGDLESENVFPSPCGVRRVRDFEFVWVITSNGLMVSVPLRGKEGAGLYG